MTNTVLADADKCTFGLDDAFSTSMKGRDEQDVISCFKLVLRFPFQLPIGIIDKDQNSWPPTHLRVRRMEIWKRQRTSYTVLSSTKSSFRESRMTCRHRYCTRKARFTGWPSPSTAGTERLRFLWLEKSISSPPLESVSEASRFHKTTTLLT